MVINPRLVSRSAHHRALPLVQRDEGIHRADAVGLVDRQATVVDQLQAAAIPGLKG